jgi:hypothetical protein
MEDDETVFIVINLSNQVITNYKLTLKDKILADGIYGVESLYGEGQVQGPEVTRGVFKDYKPLNELNPFSTLIVKLEP